MPQGAGNPMAGNNPKPMDTGTGKPNKPDENKNQQTGNAGKPPNSPAGGPDNPANGMYKDVWGHLPEKMRQEMDSYFKERFMPAYNDLLKQYYSKIAEQNKK
jgi:hypothetical protein